MFKLVLIVACLLLSLGSAPAAAEELCDPAFQNCLARLLTFIRNETVRLDVAFNLLEDQSIADAVVTCHQAGVPVRVIAEPRRNSTDPSNATMIERLRAAGNPIRQKTTGSIFHWKAFIFTKQQVVEFAATNFTPDYLRLKVAYVDYHSDAVYFSTDLALVRSFQTKYDDMWVDATNLTDYANVGTRSRASSCGPSILPILRHQLEPTPVLGKPHDVGGFVGHEEGDDLKARRRPDLLLARRIENDGRPHRVWDRPQFRDVSHNVLDLANSL